MTDTPKRIQLSRRKGWRMPANTVNVARPGQLGNPARVVLDTMVGTGEEDEDGNEIVHGPWACLIGAPGAAKAGWWFATREEAVAKAVEYYRYLAMESPGRAGRQAMIEECRGMDVACWCGPNDPCHGDVILELANAPVRGNIDQVPA